MLGEGPGVTVLRERLTRLRAAGPALAAASVVLVSVVLVSVT